MAVEFAASTIGCPLRADGDREALRILLGARNEFTATTTGQSNRLRALLLGGEDTDRQTARGALTEATLASLARRRAPREASRDQAVRHAEIHRLALALREATRALKANRTQRQAIVEELVPGAAQRHRPSDAEGALDLGGTAPQTARHPRRPPRNHTRTGNTPDTT